MELAAEAGHEAQRHAQHQRQGGDGAAKEIDEFIGGHNGAEAAEPQHHRGQQQRRGQSVEDALQRQGVAGGQVCQDGDALMNEGGVHQCRQQRHGHQPAGAVPQLPQAMEPRQIAAGAGQGDQQTDGVHQCHGEGQYQSEIGKIDRRMAVGKRIAHGWHLPPLFCAQMF